MKRVRIPFPLVEVIWLDACTYHSSIKIVDIASTELTERHTVGYLITDDEFVRVAHFFDLDPKNADEDAVEELTIIPKGWVKSITRTRRVKPPAPRKEVKDDGTSSVLQ